MASPILVAVIALVTLTNTVKSDERAPISYKYFPGFGYYHWHSEQMNWFDAHALCTGPDGGGGHLAIPNSYEEFALFQQLMGNAFTNFAHIGVTSRLTSGNFLSVLGEELNKTGYSEWIGTTGLPDPMPANKYAAFYKSGGMKNFDGSDLFSFICELPTWRNYELVAGIGYYKFYSEIKTFQAALATCIADGAQLAIPNSPSEYNQLMAMFNRYPNLPDVDVDNLMYIGLHHMYKIGEYMTVLDVPLRDSGYTKWATGQPLHNNTNFAVALQRNLGYFTTLETNKLPFVCEHPLK